MGWTPGVPDATALLDAIYRVDLPIDEWLDTVRTAAAPALSPAIAVIACAYSIDDAGGRLDALVGGTPEMFAGVSGLFEELRDSYQRGGAWASWVERRMRRPSAADTHLHSYPTLAGTPHGRWYSTFGASDAFSVHGFSPERVGCVLGAFLPSPCDRIEPARLVVWDRIGAHLGAAVRLRRALQGAGIEVGAREALRHAARVVDRARAGKLGDPASVLAGWTALIAGRWSLVDHFEADGRRFVVAKVNDPLPASPSELSARERQVVAFAALGHSNKHIAYELGLSLSTIAGALRRAGRKLGKRTRIALIRHVTGTAPTSRALWEEKSK